MVEHDYRKSLYENYARDFQNAGDIFDSSAAAIWAKVYDHYFRGWLPEDKDVAIADVGCGGGNLLYYLKKRGYRNLYGVDMGQEQVRLARQVVDSVEEADLLDFLDAHPLSFDCIAGLHIVEHFGKTEVLRFLDLCHKALRPGGRLILQTPNAESPWGMKLRYGDLTHEVAFDPQCLRMLCERSGFCEVEAKESDPAVHGIPSLLRWILWKMIWMILAAWNLAETGRVGSGIYTREFLLSGTKPRPFGSR